VARPPVLGPAAHRRIEQAVADLFARLRYRLLGRVGAKSIVFTARPGQHRADLSLPGLFDSASRAEGMRPNEELREALMRVADRYLVAHEQLAKARTVHAVQSFLDDSHRAGTVPDVKKVLGGELARVMGQAVNDVKRIVDTESTRARNAGTLDAISKINAMAGVNDPVVYFAVVNDQHLCGECKRLHLMPDGVTPRYYRMSEIGSGYHKRGEPNPKLGGLHPHCRCTLVTLMPGYGHVAGKLGYVGPDYDGLAVQRAA
jgi:hypothetical protein